MKVALAGAEPPRPETVLGRLMEADADKDADAALRKVPRRERRRLFRANGLASGFFRSALCHRVRAPRPGR